MDEDLSKGFECNRSLLFSILSMSIFSYVRMKADLRLPVYQDIDIKLLLEFNNFADFLFNCTNILLLGDPERMTNKIVSKRHMEKKTSQSIDSRNNLLVSLVFTTHLPQFNSLREGSNSGSWEDWKVELLLLSIQSTADICGAAMIRTLQCSSL